MNKTRLKQLIKECVNEVLNENLRDNILNELVFARKSLGEMKSSGAYSNEQLDIIRQYISLIEKMYKSFNQTEDITLLAKTILDFVDTHNELILVNHVITKRFYDFLHTV
jgi:hypothetical protein